MKLVEGSRLSHAYDGATISTESYNCNYGLSPARPDIFSGALLRFSAFDDEGGVRGFELHDHRSSSAPSFSQSSPRGTTRCIRS